MWADLDALPIDLGNLDGNPNHKSYALDVNNSGVVAGQVGVVRQRKPVTHAALWKDGAWTDLDPDGTWVEGSNFYRSSAHAVNCAGTAVGVSETEIGFGRYRREVLKWKNGSTTVLPMLINGNLESASVVLRSTTAARSPGSPRGGPTSRRWPSCSARAERHQPGSRAAVVESCISRRFIAMYCCNAISCNCRG